MYKYVKFDKKSGLCTEVGISTNTDFYKSIGMVYMEVEQAYDGSYWLKGYAPTKSDDEQTLEELQKEQTELNAQIEQLKDQLLTATLADDTDQIESIKAQYQTLVGGE